MTHDDARPARISERFAEAVRYATGAHAGQTRKGTDVPYVSHLLAVASLVLEAGGDESEAIAAMLHDAPEDTGGSEVLADIRVRFGERIAAIVDGCTDSLAADPTEKAPWRERKQRYAERLSRERDPSVLLVSAADKVHNAESMLRDYRSAGSSIWKSFKGRRDGTLWNDRMLLDAYRLAAHDARRDALVARFERAVDLLETESAGDATNTAP